MKTQLESRSEENKKLSQEFMKVTEEMERLKDSQPVRQVVSSREHMQQTSRSGPRQAPPSEAGRRKLFSEVLKDERDKRHTITLKSKDSGQSEEQIKLQLKKEINTADIKVGVKTL